VARHVVLAIKIAFCGATCCTIPFGIATPVSAGGPFGSISIEGWKGGGFTNDATGVFAHCAVVKAFPRGYEVILLERADHAWGLGLSNSAWDLTAGTQYTVELLFDGQTQFRYFARATSGKVFAGQIPETAIARLGKSQLMAVTWNGQNEQFNLGPVDRLPRSLSNCVERMATAGIAGAGDFTLSSVKPPIARTASKSDHAAVKSAEAQPETRQTKPSKSGAVSGTGFAVSTKGHVVTNNHVVRHCIGDIHGNLTGEPAMSMRVVSTDEINDLALLQARASFKELARIRTTPMHSGDPVVAIGFPLHGLLTTDFTVTTGIVNSLSGILNDTRFLQISAEVQPGNSGGPLLDTSGNLVGVVSEKLNALRFAKLTGDLPQNINFAIKTGALRDFLDNSVVSYQTAEPRAELKNAEIAEHAHAYTMLIGCTANTEDAARK
jgi:S1-C subfamily serine protease